MSREQHKEESFFFFVSCLLNKNPIQIWTTYMVENDCWLVSACLKCFVFNQTNHPARHIAVMALVVHLVVSSRDSFSWCGCKEAVLMRFIWWLLVLLISRESSSLNYSLLESNGNEAFHSQNMRALYKLHFHRNSVNGYLILKYYHQTLKRRKFKHSVLLLFMF